ncbi:MAG: hypothetical protein U1E77_17570 [Inhella sp.]
MLSSLRINGQRAGQRAGRRPALPAGTQHLGVEFAGLDYADPGRLRYQYRLRGLDEAWTEVDAGQRNSFGEARCSRAYTLQVRAPRPCPAEWSDQLLELPFDLRPTGGRPAGRTPPWRCWRWVRSGAWCAGARAACAGAGANAPRWRHAPPSCARPARRTP